MARRVRLQFPGALYHVMNRGDRREVIFLEDADRARFIETLEAACAKTGWQVHAFVLMPNHFHLVIETPGANLTAGMKWFLGTYTSRFNRRHGMTGHLFSGRYKATLVGGQGGYLRTVVDYVHLNPARAKLIETSRALREFRWSSLPSYLAPPARRPAWLRVDRALGECGIPADTTAGRREFERRLESRRGQDLDKEFSGVREDWCFGDETFRQELLEHSEKTIQGHHYGPEVHASAEEKAERIVRQDLSRLDWSEEELRTRPKGDPMKLATAARLRDETTMNLQWIADRLRMGSRGYLTHLLYWRQRGARPPKPAPAAARGSRPVREPRSGLREPGSTTAREREPLPDFEPSARQRVKQAPVVPRMDPLPFDPSFD